MSCYFLTGGTGVVGSRVLEDLLDRSAENRVCMLVRAQSDAAAVERVQQLLRRTIGERAEQHFRRITVMRGDAQHARFGLTAPQWDQLVAQCRRIVHSAGLVRMNLPLEQARASAVGAAENVLSLARLLHEKGRLEKAEFVSTVGVGGRSREVREEWIRSSSGFHNTYEQAKAEAEDRVHAGVTEGLPITVHRPSMVVGDSDTGRIASFQVFYHLCEFLSGLRSKGLFPSFGETKLDTVPVNHVAAAITWSSGELATVGRILHLCSGPDKAIAIGDLQRRVLQHFGAHGIPVPRVRSIPRGLFRAMLIPLGVFAPEKTRRAIRTAPVFLEYLASNQSFENHATERILGEPGLSTPAPDLYLETVLEYYLRHGRPSRPS